MMPGYTDQQIKARLLIWWAIWAWTLGFLLVLYFFLGFGKPLPANADTSELPRNLMAIVPLFISSKAGP